MITRNDLRNLLGATAHDPSGDKIGKVGQVYYDDDTDQPKWITVHTGLFGTNESFVPLQGAQVRGRDRHPRLRQAEDQERTEHRPGRPPVSRGRGAALPVLRGSVATTSLVRLMPERAGGCDRPRVSAATVTSHRDRDDRGRP